MIEEIKTDVDSTVNELNAEVQKAKRDVDAAKARLESAVGSIAKAEAEQFINDKVDFSMPRLDLKQQNRHLERQQGQSRGLGVILKRRARLT